MLATASAVAVVSVTYAVAGLAMSDAGLPGLVVMLKVVDECRCPHNIRTSFVRFVRLVPSDACGMRGPSTLEERTT
jgi:hypothetical protein